ncbi:MAG: oligosaccharide flippase family protein [Bacteroidota bacterium]
MNVKAWLSRTLSDSGFRGPVLTLLSGSGLALALGYGSDLILTRLYSPSEYERFAAFVFLLYPLNAIGALRYEDALMLPATDDEAAPLLGLSFGIVLVMTAAIGLAVWGLGPAIADYFGLPGLRFWLWFLPLMYLLERLRRLAELWLIRQSRFRPTSAAQVVQTVSNKGLAVGLGLDGLKHGGTGLFVGYMASRLGALAVLFRAMHPWPLRWPSRSATRALLRRYRRFPLFSCPSSLINASLAVAPVLLLGGVFADAFIAHYHRVFHTIAVPLGLIGGAVGQVFFVRAAEANRQGSLTTLTTAVHGRLVAVGLFPTLAVVVAGPDLFAFVFSEPWRPAGAIAQALAPWLFLASVASPLTRVFDVLERQRLDLGSSLAMLVLITAGLLSLLFTDDPMVVVLALGMAGVVARMVHLAVMMHIADASLWSVLRPYGGYALCAAPGLLLTAWASASASPFWTFAAAAAGMLVYALLAYMRERGG